MSHVFISYAHQDSEFAQSLSTDLQAAGIAVWFDMEDIEPGQEWGSTIRDVISKASVLLYIASKAGNESPWMAREVALTIELRKPIIPLVVGEPPTGAMLRTYEWIDFHTDYGTALDRLISALRQVVDQGKPLPPSTPKSKGYVFISYAEEDSAFVTNLRDFLKERGYGYWDYQESDRDYHKQFSLELEEIITGAAATLSILSPDWKRSKWAPKEYMFSEEVGVPVFLLRFRDMGPTLVIAGVPYIDFVADVQQGFTKLDHELRRKGLI